MPDVIPDLPSDCWPISPGCLTGEWESLEDEVQERSKALATATLRRLTLFRVGGCPVTVRPCGKKGCSGIPLGYNWGGYGDIYAMPFFPFQQVDGSIVNCCPSMQCDCEAGCKVNLPGFVGAVSSIKVDGVEKLVGSPPPFRVDDNSTLVYTGTGDCPFPTSQNMGLNDTEDNTFSITYLPAHPVDGLGAWAAGVLAVEFSKACTGKTCRLPTGVTQVVRQGVTLTVTPGAFPNGLTGIREVDTFISLWNPNGLKVAPSVWSPDQNKVKTATWTAS